MDGLLGVVSATLATTKVRKERMFIHKSRRVYIWLHPTKSRESYKVYALSIFVRKILRSWNWHLVVPHFAEPVAVASQGQSLRHS
jgi:hypothetical protein